VRVEFQFVRQTQQSTRFIEGLGRSPPRCRTPFLQGALVKFGKRISSWQESFFRHQSKLSVSKELSAGQILSGGQMPVRGEE
jgi:hypothetical protein